MGIPHQHTRVLMSCTSGDHITRYESPVRHSWRNCRGITRIQRSGCQSYFSLAASQQRRRHRRAGTCPGTFPQLAWTRRVVAVMVLSDTNNTWATIDLLGQHLNLRCVPLFVQYRPTKSSTFDSYFNGNFLSRFGLSYTLQAVINWDGFRHLHQFIDQ